MIENLEPIRQAVMEAKERLHEADSQAFLTLRDADYKEFHSDYLEALNALDRMHQFRPRSQRRKKLK